MSKINLTDGASVGATFTFLQTQLDAIVTPEIQTQVITVGLSLLIGIVAKLVSKFVASIFSRKKVSKDEILETIRESIRKEMDQKGLPYTEEEIEQLATAAAARLAGKIAK